MRSSLANLGSLINKLPSILGNPFALSLVANRGLSTTNRKMDLLITDQNGLITDKPLRRTLDESLSRHLSENHTLITSMSDVTYRSFRETAFRQLESSTQEIASETKDQTLSEEDIARSLKERGLTPNEFFTTNLSQLCVSSNSSKNPAFNLPEFLKQLHYIQGNCPSWNFEYFNIPEELPIKEHTNFNLLPKVLADICFLYPELLKNKEFIEHPVVKSLFPEITSSALKEVLEHANPINPPHKNTDTFAQIVKRCAEICEEDYRLGETRTENTYTNLRNQLSEAKENPINNAETVEGLQKEIDERFLREDFINGGFAQRTEASSPFITLVDSGSHAERLEAEAIQKTLMDILNSGGSIRSR